MTPDPEGVDLESGVLTRLVPATAPCTRSRRPASPPLALPVRDEDTVVAVNGTGLRLLSFGWRQRGRAYLTVLAKATCDLAPGAPARLRSPGDEPTCDLYDDDDRLLYPSDHAPRKSRADVTVVAAAGDAAAGLRFGRGEHAIDRTVAAVHQLGPVAPSHPTRVAHAGRHDEAWAAERWPHRPDDASDAFYQAAPVEQQVPFPRGDEPFELHLAGRKVLRGTLPGLSIRCFVKGVVELGGGFSELGMHLDTVAFDLDAEVVHLVWRAVLEVSDEHAPEVRHLYLQRESLDDHPASLEEAEARYEVAAHGVVRLLESATGGPPAACAPAKHRAAAVVSSPMTRADLDPLLAGGSRGLNLAGADLRALDLRELDLSGALLSGADLRGSMLQGADLSGAQLAGADLSGADLSGANLAQADLHRALLRGARLPLARLWAASFAHADATDADLTGAAGDLLSLHRACLTGARLDGLSGANIDLTGARLEGCSFRGAVLPLVRLLDARAASAVFDDAQLDDATARGADLTEASLRGVRAAAAVWHAAGLEGANLTAAVMPRSSFVRARCAGAIFFRADLSGARFRRSQARGASFFKANLAGVDFDEADLTDADLTAANLYGTVGPRAVLAGARLDRAIVDHSQLVLSPVAVVERPHARVKA